MTTCALNAITIYNRFSKCTVDQSIDISFRMFKHSNASNYFL